MTVLYRRPSGTEGVHIDWKPDDKQAGAEAIAAVLEDVADAAAALEQAPHDVTVDEAEQVRMQYDDLTTTS